MMLLRWFRRCPDYLWRCPLTGAFHDPAVLHRKLSAAPVTVDSIRAALSLPELDALGHGYAESQATAAYESFCRYVEGKG